MHLYLALSLSVISAPPIHGAKEAFLEAQQRIREDYVDEGVSDDELYTGAIAGMLDRLIQTKQVKVNALLDPDQLHDMHDGMRGTVIGVGVMIKQFEDVVYVKGTIDGSPAKTAGLQAGDRILAVDKKPLKGLMLAKIVDLIRGPEGTTIDLLVQRDQNEWTVPLTRKTIPVPAIFASMLNDKTGYLHVMNFNENIASEIDRYLSTTLKGAKGLVIDVRGCPGGLFDASIAVAERFLPPGKRIVSTRGRDGKEQATTSKSKDPGDALPLVVLIDHDTASSAEIVAAALAENGRAKLVGEATLGKSTVERIIGLRSGWALKLSVARFYSPNGRNWQDAGITPDFAIAKPAQHDDDAWPPTAENDPAMKAALSVLELERR